MNLTFGVCWIEDQPGEALRSAVEAAVRENGFEPEVELVSSEEDIEAFAERQHHYQVYDLILLDLRLGDKLRGDDLAPAVRRHFRSTPIVFYSAVPEGDLRLTMAAKAVDGVYCTNRADLAVRVGQIVSDLSPALNRLSGMRGLAAQVVAECDQHFRKILLHVGGDRAVEQDVVSSLKTAVTDSHRRQSGTVERIDNLGELLARPVVSSGLLFDEVSRRLRQHGQVSEEFQEARLAIRGYRSSVLEVRNILSHALEEPTDEGWVIRGGPQKRDLTTGHFPRFRSEFLSQRAHVRRLAQILVGE